MNEDINGRLSKLETKVDEHSRLLDKQSAKNDLQVEMNTLLKMQIEANKEQNVQMKKFGETLDRVDENLTNLNLNQQQLNTNQNKLGERVSDIESTLQEQKIDPVKLFKSILAYILTGAGGIVLAYIYMKFGLKN